MSNSRQEHFVYHVTTADRAEQCLNEGIIPHHTTLASAASTALDTAYDTRRPAHVIELGVSRTDSVYAHPDHEHALARRNGGWLNRTQEKLAILSIFVPRLDEVFVADGLLNVEPYTSDEYWDSLVSLADYRSQETPTYVAMDRRYNNHRTRFVYMWPEVLIQGIVTPEHISLIQS